jgi:hypothetical protein
MSPEEREKALLRAEELSKTDSLEESNIESE